MYLSTKYQVSDGLCCLMWKKQFNHIEDMLEKVLLGYGEVEEFIEICKQIFEYNS